MANYQLSKTGAQIDQILDLALEHETKKANVDGSYEGMTVGLAQNLVNDEGKTLDTDASTSSGSAYADQPFVQRATAIPFSGETVSVNSGIEEWKKEQAFSIVKNQWAKQLNSNNWVSNTEKASVSFLDNVCTQTYSAVPQAVYEGGINIYGYYIPFVKDNLYLLTAKVKSPKATNFRFYSDKTGYSANLPVVANTWTFISVIHKPYVSGDTPTFILSPQDATIYEVGDAIEYTDINVVCLNQFFTSRPAMANCTKQWFLQNYPDYTRAVPYNVGTIVDTEDYTYETTGVNLWDEEWEVGGISDITGQDVTFNGIRSVGYSECFPSTDCYFYCGSTTNLIIVYFYDKNKAFIGTARNSSSFVFAIPANACYFRFALGATYGTTYNNDIQICNHWTEPSVEQTYHKYELHTKQVSWAFTSTGKGKSAGSVADTKDYVNKKNVEKVGKIDLATLTWTLNNTYMSTQVSADVIKASDAYAGKTNAFCDKYSVGSESEYQSELVDMSIRKTDTNVVTIIVRGTTTPTGILNHELATYIETDMTDEEANNTIEENDYGVERKVSSNANEIFSGSATTIFYQDNPLRQIYNNKDAIEQNASDIDALEAKIPAAPAEDGTYSLKVTVASGTATYSWIAD